MSFASSQTADRPGSLTLPLLITMAIACGLGVANLMYCQPLLGQISRSLHVTEPQVGTIPTLTQIGFAVGVLFIAPLGDVLERRRLIMTMLVLVSISLLVMAWSPSLAILQIAAFSVGITSVISTLVIPFAVHLAYPSQKGQTVGFIASAMLMGLLLSRTVSGTVGELLGWHAMFAIAALFMAGLFFALWALLPKSQPSSSLPYPELLRSMFGIVREHRSLREATYNGYLVYAALTAFWTTLIFLVESPAYGWGSKVAGMFGLVGATSALMAPITGKLADRHSPRMLVGVCTSLMLASYVVLYFFGTNLVGLILGIIGLDIAAQSTTISNQATVYSLPGEIHSRAYTVYRAFYSFGGATGAALGTWAWKLGQWHGVCLAAIGLLVLALSLHAFAQRVTVFRTSEAS